MNKNILFLILLLANTINLFSQPIYNKDGIRLYHHLSAEEAKLYETVDMTLIPTDAPVGQLRPVAEYEPAEAVLVRYPFGIPITLIKEMAKDCKVITLVASESQKTTVLNQYNSNGVNTDNCEFLIANTDSYWTRDYGPWFMAIDNQEVAMYDFTYNRPRPNDNNINTLMANYLSMDRYASTVQHCGGNFMNDGTSQAASTKLTLTENPGYTEAQLQQHYLEYMGIEQYHFVDDPLLDYIQHVDCWGKYLAPNKVLVGQVPETDSRYSLFEATADYFATQTSPWGMPMEVYRVYTPGAQGYYGTATPYTNSLILNKKVFVALTGNENDNAAIQTYQQAMPGYEIVGINYNDWIDTDALHCRTHEIADRCMLYIKHMPYFGEIENTESLTFSTELYSYCDYTIYSDSVIIYLRINGGNYEKYNMSYTGDNIWEVTINDLPNGLIEYYVFAADESGRKECHPYIGAPDPHDFTLVNGSINPLPALSLNKVSSSVYSENPEIVEDHIIITNTGNAELSFEVTDITFDEMLTVYPLNGTVQPDDSQTIILKYDFNNVGNGTYEGNFILISNDPDNLETEISLEATLNYLGIDDLVTSEIKIYPNPVSDKLYISYEGNNSVKAYIYNILGKQLKEVDLTNGINIIDVQDLSSSIYFLRIDTDTFKFIKK
ncbi:MAG: agmatine deiminase family protein [Bacteroidales bacterium]|jgi:agmatine/peptidylarginine deiminase|nr:agmatine deiminase family protein [Bacteroidales bacterium]